MRDKPLPRSGRIVRLAVVYLSLDLLVASRVGLPRNPHAEVENALALAL
jgi:hypothetical protein